MKSPRRHAGTGNAIARNVHPRLRLVAGAQTRNPYEALRRAHDTARPRSPRTDYRHFVRRLWQDAA